MDVSANALRRATVETLKSIELTIKSIEETAAGKGVHPEDLRDHNNNWVMAAPLLAKAQCLQTLTLLNEKR